MDEYRKAHIALGNPDPDRQMLPVISNSKYPNTSIQHRVTTETKEV